MDRHIDQGEFSSQSSNTVTDTKEGLEWSGPSTPTDKWVLFFLCGIKILATTGLLMTSRLVVVCVCVWVCVICPCNTTVYLLCKGKHGSEEEI